jgi:hypothetical protein
VGIYITDNNGTHDYITNAYDQKILNDTTSDNLLAANVYVGYRRQHPDLGTVEEVQKKSQEKNIDFSQLIDWPANHCK